jgi:hypothetical protein
MTHLRHHGAILVVTQRRSFTPGVEVCGPETEEGAPMRRRAFILLLEKAILRFSRVLEFRYR